MNLKRKLLYYFVFCIFAVCMIFPQIAYSKTFDGSDGSVLNEEYFISNVDGTKISTRAENGRPKLLIFVQRSCATCYYLLKELNKEQFPEVDIVVAVTDGSGPEEGKQYVNQLCDNCSIIGYDANSVLWKYVSKTHLCEDEGYLVTPCLIYISKDNKIVYAYSGGDNDFAYCIKKYLLKRPSNMVKTDIKDICCQSGGVKLTWDRNYSCDGYKIYRKVNNGNYKLVKTINSSDIYTWTDKNANVSYKKYTYVIKGFRKNSKGKITYAKKGKTATIYILPAPKLTTVKKRTSTSIRVKWVPNTKVDGYIIQYSYDNHVVTLHRGWENTDNSTIIEDLERGKEYKISIASYKYVNGVNYISPWSKELSVKL